MLMIADWNNFFTEQKVDDSTKNVLLSYIENLNFQNLPVIFDFIHLSKLLGIRASILTKIIFASQFFYREFNIPKKSGGTRTISTPYPILSYCQKWVLDEILKKISVTENATAYKRKSSIIKNASIHLNNKQLLKIDLKDFFDSISSRKINSIFLSLGYSEKVSHFLTAICCKSNCLAQGACTSPYLSNIVSIELDKKIDYLARKHNLIYSRYADDICVSGDIIENEFIDILKTEISNYGFTINNKKSCLKLESQRKIITGIIVTDRLNTPKKYRREFRKNFHYLQKNGVNEFNGINGSYNPLHVDRLLGQCNYILSVTPNSSFHLKAKETLLEFKRQYITKT